MTWLREWFGFIAMCAAVVAASVGFAFFMASTEPPNPWTSIGGDLQYRCEGTTAIYRSTAGFGSSIDAVDNDPACER